MSQSDASSPSPECLQCQLVELVPYAMRLPRQRVVADILTASTSTLAAIQAFGLDATIDGLCSKHKPIALKLLARVPS